MQHLSHTDTQHFISDEAELHYIEAGNPHGEPVLMLHGGFGTFEDFESIVDPLLNDFRIIAMDARGQGRSTRGRAPLTYEQMQLDAERLLTHLNINEASLIGFSDGGMTAHRMAIAQNITVSKLVSIAAPWRQKDLSDIAGLLNKITPESWEEKFPESYQLYTSLNPELNFKTLVPDLKLMWLDDSKRGGYPDRDISSIKSPMLIIRGDDDHLFSLESACELRANVEQACLLNVPFAGHEVHKDQQEIVQNMVHWFLAGIAEG